ncbi:sugar phosphate isomerase/epimerase family protein [candidate division KSB1 bacterium]
MSDQLKDFSKLCIHTISNKPWDIDKCIRKYSDAGIKGVTVWRELLAGKNIRKVGNLITDSGLTAVSLSRGGFFVAEGKKDRLSKIENNKRIIDEASELRTPLIVLVCGADPAVHLEDAGKQIFDGISAILPYAEERGVKLGIEPLHPMYADTRSAVNTLKQANDICEKINSPYIGVIVDVYHLWWDPELEKEIERCGHGNKIFAFHISDWKTPTEDLLNDRGLMGEGCIPIKKIRILIEKAGFNGFNEVEIFSNRYWAQDQDEFLKKIKESYLKHC